MVYGKAMFQSRWVEIVILEAGHLKDSRLTLIFSHQVQNTHAEDKLLATSGLAQNRLLGGWSHAVSQEPAIPELTASIREITKSIRFATMHVMQTHTHSNGKMESN